MIGSFIKHSDGKIEKPKKEIRGIFGLIERTLPTPNFPFIGIEQPEMLVRRKIRENILKYCCKQPFELIPESYFDGRIEITLQGGRSYSPTCHQLYIYNSGDYFQIQAQVNLNHFELYRWKKALENTGGYYLLTLYENGRPLLERMKIVKNEIKIMEVPSKRKWSYW